MCSQNGLQPIHHAAQEGHEEVVRMLVDDFHVKPDATSNVSQTKSMTLMIKISTAVCCRMVSNPSTELVSKAMKRFSDCLLKFLELVQLLA